MKWVSTSFFPSFRLQFCALTRNAKHQILIFFRQRFHVRKFEKCFSCFLFNLLKIGKFEFQVITRLFKCKCRKAFLIFGIFCSFFLIRESWWWCVNERGGERGWGRFITQRDYVNSFVQMKRDVDPSREWIITDSNDQTLK